MKYCIAFVLFLVSFAIEAQDIDTALNNSWPGKYFFGLKAGSGFSRLQWYNPAPSSYGSFMKEQMNLSAVYGLEGNYGIKKRIFLSPSLLFTSKYNSFSAYRYNNVSPTHTFLYQQDFIYSLKYIELHLLLKYRYDIKKIFFQGAFGPYIAMRSTADVTYNKYYIESTSSSIAVNWITVFDPSDVKGNFYYDAKDQIKAVDMGISGFIGVGMNIFHGSIFLEGSAGKGFVNILKKSFVEDELKLTYPFVNKSTGTPEYTALNTMYSITVGYCYYFD